MSPLFKKIRKGFGGDGSKPSSSLKGNGMEKSKTESYGGRRLSLGFVGNGSSSKVDGDGDGNNSEDRPSPPSVNSKFQLPMLSNLNRRRSSSGALPSQPTTPSLLNEKVKEDVTLSKKSLKGLSQDARVEQTRIKDFPSSPSFGNFLPSDKVVMSTEIINSSSGSRSKNGIKKFPSLRKKNSLEKFQSKKGMAMGNNGISIGWEHSIPRNLRSGKLGYDPKRRPKFGGRADR